MGKTSFKSKDYHSEEVLELAHIDLYGPIGIESYSGDKYFILFIDDYSRMISIMCLKENSKEFQNFKWYLEKVEKKLERS